MKYAVFLPLLASSVVLTACEAGKLTSAPTSINFAGLEITSDASPATYRGFGAPQCPVNRHCWSYRLTLRETNGVGATIQSWTRFVLDTSGNRLTGTLVDPRTFPDSFDECGPASNRLEANGTKCGTLGLDTSTSAVASGYIEERFAGIDDSGFPVVKVKRVPFARAGTTPPPALQFQGSTTMTNGAEPADYAFFAR